MRCPWYLFHRLFEFGQGHRGPMIPYCPGPHELSVHPCVIQQPRSFSSGVPSRHSRLLLQC
ncbi:unnamed protein product [Staurois parvus]|uniref:Uncharacterized protein n=1 Tax=Staurois parvus TaxID=386267 RepID=A0ABN9BI30_9NEOB|nr:unnamed protein product [Staurois parvus]